jgi:hypothetical protein
LRLDLLEFGSPQAHPCGVRVHPEIQEGMRQEIVMNGLCIVACEKGPQQRTGGRPFLPRGQSASRETGRLDPYVPDWLPARPRQSLEYDERLLEVAMEEGLAHC